ncbi:hypothetical protein [Xanthobacter dioxanivorans]|uniref:hypothetical protein n=1 Tax=Xanthobacter dioxanivorans TaxID=2528964 RepID=UPI001E3B13ED|nr:hypothetical protein [Xanthobacter dioxanivorans]
MQPQAERPESAIRAHGAVGEGRIADRQIEMRRQVDAGKVACDDPSARLKEPGDPRRDRIDLDTGDVRDGSQVVRHQRGEESCADAGLQHPPTAPAET